jgi:hypothetical protein
MPDGKVTIFSGFDQGDGGEKPGAGKIVDQIEEYDPASGAFRTLATGKTLDTYPSMHLIAGGPLAGQLFYSGARWQTTCCVAWAAPPSTALFNAADGSWQDHGTLLPRNRTEAMSVTLPFTAGEASKVLMIGGGNEAVDAEPRSAAIMDFASPDAEWRRVADMRYRRTNVAAVTLPSGEVLVLGGEQNYKWDPRPGVVRETEIFDPATETFRSTAWMTRSRTYHSVALLLPDGRVFAAGGVDPTRPARVDQNQKDYEVYSPPYLFKGERPVIDDAPASIRYAAEFPVATPSAVSVAKVALIRPMAVTHHTSPEQRMVYLPFERLGSRLIVRAPGDGNVAMPGYYMLFIVDGRGVPSVAKFVRLE